MWMQHSSKHTMTTCRIRSALLSVPRRTSFSAFSTSTTPVPLRRRSRPVHSKFSDPLLPSLGGSAISEPFSPHESNPQEYVRKTTLSPWVPVPDAVARAMLDMAELCSDDIHVDLGSGDGRVNFHALDTHQVQHTIGIDIDQAVVDMAEARKRKRHPVPENIEFIVADLLDSTTEGSNTAAVVWEKIRSATVITMYFAQPALQLLRPILERRLVGCQCRIITCGYEMPGWQASSEQVVLGTSLSRYDWGNDNDNNSVFAGDELLDSSPEGFMRMNNGSNPMMEENNSKFSGANVIDHTGQYPIRGYNPDLFYEEEDDDDDWDAESSEEESEEEEDAMVKSSKK